MFYMVKWVVHTEVINIKLEQFQTIFLIRQYICYTQKFDLILNIF